MKKTFTRSFLFAICLSFFASCSKDVKAPVKIAGATTASANMHSGTQTQTANQTYTGHTCNGGGSYNSNTGGGSH